MYLRQFGRQSGATALVCLPPAGSSNEAFAGWGRLAPASLDIFALQMPARGALAGSEMPDSWQTYISGVSGCVTQTIPVGRPYVLFGHSLGALTAYELARLRQERGEHMPQALVLSSYPPPHAIKVGALQNMSGHSLLELMAVKGVIDPRQVAAKEFSTYFGRLLELDVGLLQGYEPGTALPVDRPAALIYGDHDRATNADLLSEWSSYFTKPPHVRSFQGGHFYYRDQAEVVLTFFLSWLGEVEAMS